MGLLSAFQRWFGNRKEEGGSKEIVPPCIEVMADSGDERPLARPQRYITVEFYAQERHGRRLVEVKRIENISCEEMKEWIRKEVKGGRRFGNEVSVGGRVVSEKMDSVIFQVVVEEDDGLMTGKEW